ncbi:MAG TPA: nucleoside monophosphate kinase, partial [Candidatus Paceibacterota bacterium]|nr:nucleoside monophosphate kinase [Candidatus Paceibacterota bacterium]
MDTHPESTPNAADREGARTVLFIGKPGCGKGDQAKLLAEKTGWKIIASGEQFRAMATEDTLVGRKVKSVGDAGMLQPHWLAEYLFLKNLFLLAEDDGAIFDGFGREVQETELIMDA